MVFLKCRDEVAAKQPISLGQKSQGDPATCRMSVKALRLHSEDTEEGHAQRE
jgi:hypothetical protein